MSEEERLFAESEAREMRRRQRVEREEFIGDIRRAAQLLEYRRTAPYGDCPYGGRPLPALKGIKACAAWSVAIRNRKGRGIPKSSGPYRLGPSSVAYGRMPGKDGFFK